MIKNDSIKNNARLRENTSLRDISEIFQHVFICPGDLCGNKAGWGSKEIHPSSKVGWSANFCHFSDFVLGLCIP